MARLLMGAAHSDPVVQLVDLDSGTVTPVPSVLDGGGAFDASPLSRDGWLAVQVGYKVTAFRDGDLLRPVLLPEAWRLAPSMDRELVWIDCFDGRSRDVSEDIVAVQVDRDGLVRRRELIPLWALVGEVASGLVCTNGMWTPEHGVAAFPVEGRPVAVLDGRVIVFARPGEIETVDVESGVTKRCDGPARGSLDLGRTSYSSDGRRTVFGARTGRVLVVDVVGPRWIPLQLDAELRVSAVWLGEHSLLVNQRLDGRGWVMAGAVDLDTGTVTRWSVGGDVVPRLDVSGRFDPEQVRALMRPAGWSPPTPEERRSMLSTARAELETAAGSLAGGYLAQAAEAVRLRVCLAGRRVPVGGSRLGGRPDLPAGMRWPNYEGEPMAFLGQFRLDQVAAAAPPGSVPVDGLLLLFVGLDVEGGWPRSERAVGVRIASVGGLRRARWPARLPDAHRFDMAVVLPEPIVTLPMTPTGLRGHEHHDWAAVIESTSPRPPRHQLLGHPYAGKDDAATPVQDPGQWGLLAQIDGDSFTGFVFGDGGRLHVWVRRDDLAAGDLTSCLVTIDSY